MTVSISEYAKRTHQGYDMLDDMSADQSIYDFATRYSDFIAGYISAGGTIKSGRKAHYKWVCELALIEKG